MIAELISLPGLHTHHQRELSSTLPDSSACYRFLSPFLIPWSDSCISMQAGPSILCFLDKILGQLFREMQQARGNDSSLTVHALRVTHPQFLQLGTTLLYSTLQARYMACFPECSGRGGVGTHPALMGSDLCTWQRVEGTGHLS